MKNLKILPLILLITLNIYAVISSIELQHLNNILTENELTLESLNFPKDWGSPDFKIPKMIEILDSPMEYPNFVAGIKEKLLEHNYLDFFDFSVETIFHDYLTNTYQYDENINIKLNKIKNSRDILKYAEHVFEICHNISKNTFMELSETELHHLEYLLYSLAQGGNESEEKYAQKYSEIIVPDDDTEIEYFIEILKKIDFQSLMASAQFFYKSMDMLKTADFSNLNFKKQNTLATKYGRMVVGTNKDDTYSDDYVFIYEPAGNDGYFFNISTNINKPFIAIIDLDGDDTYRNQNIGSLFNAMFGIIFHYDANGNDFYSGDDLAFSANIGALISIDGAGSDTYITGSKSLAAATFGIATLINYGGNNYFSGTCMTQGFGGTLGLGILASYSNKNTDDIINQPSNDVFFSGGKYKHAPLVPDDYRTMSQGFGFGIRPDMAGGIGILFNEAGNDNYIGGVYAQGSAYWYALGILIDLAGNDVYRAVYYPQGSGIHLAAGFLYDEEGDDSYYSRFGPGQGAGHDYGIGFLVDKSGNDHYSIDGGNGMGITNSVGIFIDSKGNDRYERKRQDSYGIANTSRGSGGIGLFLDMGGDDLYPNDNMSNNKSWTNGFLGAGLDLDYNIETTADTEIENETENEIIDIDPLIPIDELFKMASEWEVGSAVLRVRTARTLMLSRDEEMADYIYNFKLQTKSGLELRAILELAENSDYMRDTLVKGLTHEHFRAISNSIYLIGSLADPSYLDVFEEMLDENKNVGSILSALGNIHTDKSIDMLERFIDTDDKYRRVIVARSLLAIDTERSKDLLMSLENSDCFLIKSMLIRNE